MNKLMLVGLKVRADFSGIGPPYVCGEGTKEIFEE